MWNFPVLSYLMIGWCTGSRCGCWPATRVMQGRPMMTVVDRPTWTADWVGGCIVVLIIGTERGGGVGDGKAGQKCGTRNCVKSDFREWNMNFLFLQIYPHTIPRPHYNHPTIPTKGASVVVLCVAVVAKGIALSTWCWLSHRVQFCGTKRVMISGRAKSGIQTLIC